jgi:hypothetical protein
MARVRQQGYRACIDARTGLKDNKQEIEDDACNKRGACAMRAMVVVVMVTVMTLATVMMVVMVAMTVVVVMISHLFLL